MNPSTSNQDSKRKRKSDSIDDEANRAAADNQSRDNNVVPMEEDLAGQPSPPAIPSNLNVFATPSCRIPPETLRMLARSRSNIEASRPRLPLAAPSPRQKRRMDDILDEALRIVEGHYDGHGPTIPLRQ